MESPEGKTSEAPLRFMAVTVSKDAPTIVQVGLGCS